MEKFFTLQEIDDIILKARLASATLGLIVIEDRNKKGFSELIEEFVDLKQLLLAVQYRKAYDYEVDKFQELVLRLYSKIKQWLPKSILVNNKFVSAIGTSTIVVNVTGNRTFLGLIDVYVASYSGKGGFFLSIRDNETGVEAVNIESLLDGMYLPLRAGSLFPLTGALYGNNGINITGGSSYLYASAVGAELVMGANADVDIISGTNLTLSSPIITLNNALSEVTGDQNIIVRQSNGQIASIPSSRFNVYFSDVDFNGDGKTSETKITLDRAIILEHLQSLPGFASNRVLSSAMIWVVPYGYDTNDPVPVGAVLGGGVNSPADVFNMDGSGTDVFDMSGNGTDIFDLTS